MKLIKHIERGFGHAKKSISPNGQDRYLVRFFDSYDGLYVFSETSITKKILELVKGE
jgi:hypothetical protein